MAHDGHGHSHGKPAGSPFENQRAIPGVKHVVLVSSGKGGVGKSTVSANLAAALAKMGAKVGLLDADIYGPSIPRMFGALKQRPEVDANRSIIPIERHGIKLMSIGFLVEDDQAVVWRGPMLFKAMDQFLWDVQWGELDYLVMDLPPGTGDVQLTLAQKIPIAGAIAVTTPQNVALNDVIRSLDMFEKVGVPILGVVENMASFLPPGSDLPVALFPKGDLDKYLATKKLEKLAEIPFHTGISMGGEIGIPVCLNSSTSPEARAFFALAEKVRARLN